MTDVGSPRLGDVRVGANLMSFPEWSLDEAAGQLAELGYDAIGLDAPTADAVEPIAARRMLTERGLAVSTVIALDLFDVGARRLDRSATTRSLDIAGELGAEWVMTIAGPRRDLTWTEAAARLADDYGAALELAAERSLRLAIEPLHPLRQDLSFLNGLADAVDLVRRVEHPAAGVVIDTWHTWWQRDFASTVAAAGDVMACIQVSDHKAVTTRTLDRAVPGDGIVPWAEVLDAIAKSGFGGVIEFEIMAPGDGPDDHARVARDAKRWIDRERAERRSAASGGTPSGDSTRGVDDGLR